jgi:hypothetical protein
MAASGNSRSVTFTEPWGDKSWKVKYDGPYENDRLAHVEVCQCRPGVIYRLFGCFAACFLTRYDAAVPFIRFCFRSAKRTWTSTKRERSIH